MDGPCPRPKEKEERGGKARQASARGGRGQVDLAIGKVMAWRLALKLPRASCATPDETHIGADVMAASS